MLFAAGVRGSVKKAVLPAFAASFHYKLSSFGQKFRFSKYYFRNMPVSSMKKTVAGNFS